MDLDYLKLDRNLYRKDSRYQDTDINTATYYADSPGGEMSNVATEVAEGTIIQSSIWQTSGGDNRIELLPDDTLTSYRNGGVGFRLEPGLVISNNPIIYGNAQQPVVYSGLVSLSSPLSNNLPPGWSVNFTTVSGVLFCVLTHNLNNDELHVTVANSILSPEEQQSFVVSTFPNTVLIYSVTPTFSSGLFTGYDKTTIDSFYFTITRYIV